MSGLRNLANAIANDPSFASQAGIDPATAKALVGNGLRGGEDAMQHKPGKAITGKKPEKY